ncbi:MAG: hypothetical protein WBA77_08810 [Microcoleaceae cyanobacterium]
MIKFSYVDVKSIVSDIPRSEFSESKIDTLADMILECEGVLKPIFLQQIDIEKFKVVDGNLEYYAAVRAKEKNLRQGEMINAIIISADKESSIKQQLYFFNQLDTATSNTPQTTDNYNSNNQYDSRLTNLELRLEKFSNDFTKEIRDSQRKIEERLKAVEGEQKKQITPLEILNTYEQAELFKLLKRRGIRKANQLAEVICQVRDKNTNCFTDFTDVCESVKSFKKGLLGEKTMILIIDALSNF